MKTTTASFPSTVRELLEHPAWDGFIGDKLGNDLFINDPDRASRNYDAAENGSDGSTHAEHIEDWREFAGIIESDARSALNACETDEEYNAAESALDAQVSALTADIDECEKWHSENGSLETVIG
jgi:hypothetical protein